MTKKNFFVKVLGCQQNDHDGVRIKYLLEGLGMTESKPEKADLVVIVACSVRQTAVDRIYGSVRNWQKLRPATCDLPTILVTGCVLKNDKKKLAEKGVRFWDMERPQDLAKFLKFDGKLVSDLLKNGAHFSTSVPIMFGCNNFCTYCATAFTRGPERSRKMEEIIFDVQALINKYCSSPKSENSKDRDFSLLSKHKPVEFLLLGQTIDSYKDPTTGAGLSTLFHKLNDLPGNFLISFTSNHPKDMSNDIIEAVATLPKIKKEVHLPVQSGSDRILKLMKRPYTVEEYLRLVESIKSKVHKVKLTTDIIVGFPGETAEDFQLTVDLFKKVNFDLAYINKYSPRPGTLAFKMKDDVPQSEKKRRWEILNNLVNNKSLI